MEWNDEQRRVFIDTVQLFEQVRAIRRELEGYRGGVPWKRAKGRDYLFRLRNRHGHRPQHRDELRRTRPDAIGDEDLVATPIASQHWLVNTPSLAQTVIAMDGYPVHMVVPDATAFALHKLYISEDRSRDGKHRARDRRQAEVIAALAQRYLPTQVPDGHLAAFPAALRERYSELLGNAEADPAPFDDPLSDDDDSAPDPSP